MISKYEFVSFLLIAAVVGGIIWLSIKSEQRWQVFAAEHNCKVIEKTSATTTTGTGVIYDADGKLRTGRVSQTTPGKTTWICQRLLGLKPRSLALADRPSGRRPSRVAD